MSLSVRMQDILAERSKSDSLKLEMSFEDGMVAITAMAGALAPDGPILLCDFRHIWWLR